MTYRSLHNAWVFARPKESALYFGKVHIFVDRVFEGDEDIQSLRALGGKPLDGVDDKLGTIPAPNVFLLNPIMSKVQEAKVRKYFEIRGGDDPDPPLEAGERCYEVLKTLYFANLAVRAGISGEGSFVLPSSSASDVQGDEPALTLSGIQLVDTSRMSWEQILEMRQDDDSIRKLRNLRLFLSSEFTGAGVEQIRDELERRVEEHDAAARKWDADLRDSVMSILFGQEFLASMTATAGFLLTQHYTEALIAGTRVFAQLGKCGLEISKMRREYQFKTSNDPVAYIVKLREKATAS